MERSRTSQSSLRVSKTGEYLTYLVYDFFEVAKIFHRCQHEISVFLDIFMHLHLSRKRKMSGFGHRVYKNYDPRAKVIKKLAEEVFSIVGRDPLIEVFLTPNLSSFMKQQICLFHVFMLNLLITCLVGTASIMSLLYF